MRVEFIIGWRYLLTRRKEKFISLISVISIMGVAIGVAALIIVIGVMTGFDQDLREKIVGNYSHLTVSAFRPMAAEQYQKLAKQISAYPHVVGASPYVQGQVLAKEGNRFFAIGLRGIDPAEEAKVTQISKYLVSGQMKDLVQSTVILGKELAAYLGLGPGSQFTVYSPQGKLHSLKVAGIFASGMYDYDMNLAFANLGTAREVLGMGDQATSIAVKLDNLYLADKVRNELNSVLGFDYNVRTWMEVNQNFFAALQLEKLTMFIILTLIIFVAAFNIASTLIVMVVEKTKDIGILRAQGMTAASIRKIFTFQGFFIGGMGTLAGVAAGLVLCGLLKKYQFIKLPQDIYYLDRLPVSVQLWPDMAIIVACAMLITLVSTVYPASKAGKLKPVEALRYE